MLTLTPSAQVYLPASQVCSVQEPIPFHVSLLGDELALEPFAEYRPVPASFLPLSTSWSGASSTCEYVANAITTRSPRSKAARRCPLRIQIQRATVVDSRSALYSGVAGLAEGTPPAAVQDEKSHLHHTEWVGQGVVHSVSRTINSVVWSGAIIIPSDAARLGGSFEVNGLKVMVSSLVGGCLLRLRGLTDSGGCCYRTYRTASCSRSSPQRLIVDRSIFR